MSERKFSETPCLMMEETIIPYCQPIPSDVIPMLTVVAVFLLGALIYRWWHNKHARKK